MRRGRRARWIMVLIMYNIYYWMVAKNTVQQVLYYTPLFFRFHWTSTEYWFLSVYLKCQSAKGTSVSLCACEQITSNFLGIACVGKLRGGAKIKNVWLKVQFLTRSIKKEFNVRKKTSTDTILHRFYFKYHSVIWPIILIVSVFSQVLERFSRQAKRINSFWKIVHRSFDTGNWN